MRPLFQSIICWAIFAFFDGIYLFYRASKEEHSIRPCQIINLTNQTCYYKYGELYKRQNVLTDLNGEGFIDCNMVNNCEVDVCQQNFTVGGKFFCYSQENNIYRLDSAPIRQWIYAAMAVILLSSCGISLMMMVHIKYLERTTENKIEIV